MPRLSLPSLERLPGGTALASLSRRVRALIVAGVLFIVLFLLAAFMPVPYVILSPGPTYNTLGTYDGTHQIIAISGHAVHNRRGNLNLTTVSVPSGSSTNAFQAIEGWLAGDQVVVPSSAVYPPGESQQQTDQQNTADFVQSQDSAIAAASCELGYPKGFGIGQINAGSPSHGKLLPGDVFVSVGGHAASSQKQLLALLSSSRPGSSVPVVVKRTGRARTVEVTLAPPLKGRKGASLGIEVATVCQAPFTINLGLANEIGGPSAGLMFALGIMQKLGPSDLTDGRFVAGTGTIDQQGNVGPIGGIALKMIAARNKGATVFLAPADNCKDVEGAVPSGLKVIKVSSLHNAVTDLLKIERNQPVPSC